MASSQFLDLIAETRMYEHVFVRTMLEHGEYKSVIENDKKGKRLIVGTYETRVDAESLHYLAVMLAKAEHAAWKNPTTDRYGVQS